MSVLNGTSGRDYIVGTSDADTIDGMAGRDFLSGLGGGDSIEGGSGQDTLYGGKGNDTLNGGHGNDLIYGGSGADLISGGHGADFICGGSGADTLTGGKGADTFAYNSINHSTPRKQDTITDFSQSQQDQIDLHLITGLSLIGDNSFDGQAGELRSHVSGGNTFVSADINGDGKADFQIKLKGVHDLQSGDFIL